MGQSLKKFIDRTVVGNTETIKNEYYEIELLDDHDLRFIEDQATMDDAWSNMGVYYSYDDELSMIDINTLYDWLDDYIEIHKEEEENTEMEEKLLKKIEKYKGFTLHF